MARYNCEFEIPDPGSDPAGERVSVGVNLHEGGNMTFHFPRGSSEKLREHIENNRTIIERMVASSMI